MNKEFFLRMLRSVRCGISLLLLASISLMPPPCRAQVSAGHPVNDTQDATSEPAIPAILKAFETFEVVAMPAAHGQKDTDDFILSLIRDPRFVASVNDIVVEGGSGQGDAVTRYERHYPGRTFVISDLGYYGTGDEPLADANASGGVWPSLLRTKNRLGSLGLDSFLPSPLTTDQDCNVVDAFAGKSKTVADQIDAFLYLGPQKSLLAEPLPADIALDRAYRSEWLRRMKLVGMPGPSTLEEIDAQIVASAADPMLTPPRRQAVSQEMKLRMRQDCLSRKNPAANTAK